MGTKFSRTHNFLLEVWESLYRYFLSIFLSNECLPSDFLTTARNWISSLPPSADQASAHRNLSEMLADLKGICNYEGEFIKFMQSKMNEDETFNWGQFVLLDCNALFLAVRTGNWKLRIAAVKLWLQFSQLLIDRNTKNLFHNTLSTFFDFPVTP